MIRRLLAERRRRRRRKTKLGRIEAMREQVKEAEANLGPKGDKKP